MNCCDKARHNLVKRIVSGKALYFFRQNSELPLLFCPYCGSCFEETRDKRIVLDVDGVICQGRPYKDASPYPFAVEAIRKLKSLGCRVILQTARYMEQTGGNPLEAHERGYGELVEWLDKHKVPHDEVHFGKAQTQSFYVDDRAFKVDSRQGPGDWEKLIEEVKKLA